MFGINIKGFTNTQVPLDLLQIIQYSLCHQVEMTYSTNNLKLKFRFNFHFFVFCFFLLFYFFCYKGYGKCGVAVIRVSGPQTANTLKLLTKAEPKRKYDKEITKGAINPRCATLKNIWHPKTNDLIDRGLVLWFPGPNSFTGEDCCEFQVHGGVAVVSSLCHTLNSIDGLRPALAGEFTRRAFRADKLNLTEIEGLADLLHAETEIQRKQALLQMTGALTKVYNEWRNQILRAVACLEAYIDFAEDENIEPETMNDVQKTVQKLIENIEKFLNDSRKGEMRRNGIKVVILGEPNVGKSSFMNYICQRPISIVANVEGTTRDIVESSFNIAGFPVIIADTAGLRNHTFDPIEKEGISRARNYAANANLIILIVEANRLSQSKQDYETFKRDYLSKIGLFNVDDDSILDKEIIVIANKSDLIDDSHLIDRNDIVFISCTQNKGIDQALEKIEVTLRKLTDCDKSNVMTLNAPNDRHRLFLVKALQHLYDFRRYTDIDEFDYSIAALHLKQSMHQLENISGRSVDNERIYDFIFKQFCIGK